MATRCGGRVLTADYIQSVVALARRLGLKTHIDGARIFNAIRALGTTPAAYTAGIDSLSVCLSKGLAAPIGSLVIGSHEFVQRARRLRKALGGGMRQVGVIAACGICALSEMSERLVDDHANARALAVGLATIAGLQIDAATVETNILYAYVTAPGVTAAALVAALRDEEQVLSCATGPQKFRLVTHYQITAEHVPRVIEAVRTQMGKLAAAAAAAGGQ
jgi:threonine aldolase